MKRNATFRREERDARIFDKWLSCHTYEEIAKLEDVSDGAIAKRVEDLLTYGNLAKNEQILVDHNSDFDPPIYNIWKQQNKSNGVGHYQVVFSMVPEQYQHGTGHNLGSARHHAGYCLGGGG
jgi:hypothetical protein